MRQIFQLIKLRANIAISRPATARSWKRLQTQAIRSNLKKPDHWDSMVAHFAGRQGLAHSDILNPHEDGNDDTESDDAPVAQTPTPKCENSRKKPAIDRFSTITSVGGDIKDGLIGPGDLVHQAMAAKTRIGNPSEILEGLQQQTQELKKTNDNLNQFFQMQREQNAQLMESQKALLQAMTMFVQK